MRRFCSITAAIVTVLLLSLPAAAAPVVYNDEAAFRADAGPTTTYGFETHGLVEGSDYSSSSPIGAVDLGGHFDLAFTNLNAFQISDNAAEPGVVDGTHCVFTHSVYPASDYTLTFSNFDAVNGRVTAFGITITDFASFMTDPVTITYDAGGITGTLLNVPAGQPAETQNFLGLIVDGAEAFSYITLTMDDNLSGMQWFDEVIYAESPATPFSPKSWGSVKSLFR